MSSHISPRNRLLLAVLALLAGLFLYFRNTDQVEVKIADHGFEPAILNIDKGTRVKFINLGKNQHWPASNFHPTHTLYPEEGGCFGSKLDACRGLDPGESYVFKFNAAGEWSMHDHLFPGLTMVVRVGEEEGVAHSHEYSQELKTIQDLSERDPAVAWQYLKENFLVNGEATGNVHEFAHIIGNSLYERQGIEGTQVCDPSFSFGCFHGVTEKMLSASGLEALPEIEDKCGKLFAGEFQKFASCIHGTGHGLVSWENLDIKAALADCETLAPANQTYCFDGVFMEYMSAAPRAPREWQFCSSLEDKYQANCGRYLVRYFENAVSACDEAPSQTLARVCFEAVGFAAAQDSLGNFDKIKSACSKLTDTGFSHCMIFASREVIFQSYPAWQETSKKICDSLPTATRRDCLANRQETIKNYHE